MKTQRRSIGRKRHGVDGLGPLEQAQRPRRPANAASRGSGGRRIGRRRRRHGEFRQMPVPRIKPQHAVRPQPRAEPVDEIGKIVGLRNGEGDARERALLAALPLHRARAKTQNVEAIARVEAVFAKRRETFAQQREDANRIAQGPAGSRRHMPDHAVDAVKRRLQPPRADAAPLQQQAQLGGERRERRLYVGKPRQSFGKAPLHDVIGSLETRRDRIADAAGERVEPRQRLLPKARGERRARPRQKIADAAQPGARQGRRPLLGQLQRRDRQLRRDRVEVVLRGLTGRKPQIGKTRQGPRQRRPRREGRARAKTLGLETALDLVQQIRLAAEKRGGAGHIEHDAIGRIERGQRREAAVPVGERRQRRSVGDGVVLLQRERGNDRARIGDRHAGSDPAPSRRRVRRDDALAALDLAPEREGRLSGARIAPAQNPVGRQRRQEDAQETHVGTRPCRNQTQCRAKSGRAKPADRSRRSPEGRRAP